MAEQDTSENQPRPVDESTGYAPLDKQLAAPFLGGGGPRVDGGTRERQRVDAAQVWLSAFLVVVLGVIAYSNATGLPFHAEDRAFFLNAPPGPQAPMGLAWWSLKIGYALSGSPWLHHIKSISIHIANAVLLFFLCRRLLPKSPPVVPMIAGMLFVAHPLCTESVNYLVGRSSLLPAFFMLGSLLCFTRVVSREADGQRIHVWPLAWSLFFYALAWASGAGALLAPALLLGLDLALNPALPRRLRLSLHAPFWALCAGLAVVQWTVWNAPPAYPPGPETLMTFLRLIVAPYPLSVLHMTESSLWIAGAALGLILLALLPLTARSVGGFALFWALETLALTGNGWNGLRERDAYFAIAGAVLLVPWLFTRIATRVEQPSSAVEPSSPLRTIAGLAAAALVLATATGTYLRNITWQDEVTLWSDAAAKAPESPAALGNLGAAYLRQAQNMPATDPVFAEAEGALRAALDKGCSDEDAPRNLALAVMAQGRGDDAIGLFMNCVRTNPGDAFSLTRLGDLLMDKYAATMDHDSLVRAADYYKRADAVTPLAGASLSRYASAMAKMGSLESAEPVVQRAMAETPSPDGKAKSNPIRETIERVNRMEKQAAQQLTKDSADVTGLKFQAQALALRNHFVQASYMLDQLGRANVHDYPVWMLMGFIRARMNGQQNFIREWGETPIKPGEAKSAWIELAKACAGAGLWDAAAAYLQSPAACAEDNAPWLNKFAAIAAALHQDERIKDYIEKAIAANPKDYAPWLCLFDLAVEKDPAAAAKYLGEAGNRGAPESEMESRTKKIGAPPAPPEGSTTIIR